MTAESFKNRLIEYLEAEGMSRNENNIAKLLIKNIDTKNYEISYDNLGSIIFHKKSKNKNAPKFFLSFQVGALFLLLFSVLFIYK